MQQLLYRLYTQYSAIYHLHGLANALVDHVADVIQAHDCKADIGRPRHSTGYIVQATVGAL